MNSENSGGKIGSDLSVKDNFKSEPNPSKKQVRLKNIFSLFRSYITRYYVNVGLPLCCKGASRGRAKSKSEEWSEPLEANVTTRMAM